MISVSSVVNPSRPHPGMLALGERLFAGMLPRKRRTLRQFAEEEIIIPDGPFEGQRFRCDRQPLSDLFFEAYEDPYWSVFATMGPRQSSKTFVTWAIPAVYTLCELGQDAVIAAPTKEMFTDKWIGTLRPIIERSAYRHLIPNIGMGSKGGDSNIHTIHLANGASIHFAAAKTKKGREGKTAPNVFVTEAEAFGSTRGGRKKVDPNPLAQVREVMAAYEKYGHPRLFLECTVGAENGVTWSSYSTGSASRIAICCPHCLGWVTPEREHLTGWQDAQDILTAGEMARFVCPACGVQWTEEDRILANRNPKLVHRGQMIEGKGERAVIVGDRPRTDTLGLRWTAVNNMFTTTGETAKKEWKRANQPEDEDEDNSEKALCQFIWATPYKPDATDISVVDYAQIMKRADKELRRGQVPADALFLTLGVDVGQYLCRWNVDAFRPGGGPHTVDYGVISVPSRALMDADLALLQALREFRDTILKTGWPVAGGASAENRTIQQGFFDANFMTKIVQDFVDEDGWAKGLLFGCNGYGTNKRGRQSFLVGGGGGRKVRAVGEGYRVVEREDKSGINCDIDVDYWKSWVHKRFQTPMGQPGAATLYSPEPHEPQAHLNYAKSITAEKGVMEFVAGRGMVQRWHVVRKGWNHHLDSKVYGSVAAAVLGNRVGEIVEAVAPVPDAAAQRTPVDEGNPLTSYRGRW